MFGHDNQHHDDNVMPPAPDAPLGSSEGLTMPAPPAPGDDSAGSYIASDMGSGHIATAVPSAPATTDDPSVANVGTTGVTAPESAPAEDLLAIKQQALQQLSPLVGHLDQTSEEKFRTTMMMIQASDNPHLIRDAYEYAQGITDEKVRAQALLDIVNEINYFMQPHDQQPAA